MAEGGSDPGGRTPEGAVAAAPGWYADPWRMAPWRWWDGRQWTPATSPPAGAPVTRRTGRAATIENPRRRRRLAYELLIVLAVFPFPYAVSAVASLVTSLLDPHEVQARYPYVIPGQPGASLPFDVLMFLVPLAAPALVLYLLYASGEGASSIGLDKHRWRGDLALLLPVFLVAFFIPLDLFQVLLQHLHLHQYVPSTSKVPGAYGIVAVVAALQAGVVEEIVVLGYLVRRLEQRGWAARWVVVAAVLVRVS